MAPFKLLSSPEVEFRVLDSDGNPTFKGMDIFSYAAYGEQQEVHFDMMTKLAKAGVPVFGVNPEYGSGQFEIPLEATLV